MAVLFRRSSDPSETGNGDGWASTSRREPTIAEVVAERLISAEFQPIVDLSRGETVGYEALARGPLGTAFERPAPMFAAAEAAGLAWELDLAAHAAAFEAAVRARLNPLMSLFINAATPSVSGPVPDDLAPTLALAQARLRVFMEISERSLSVDPQATLLGIERARAAGWGVALDNVGVTAASLAVMPFANPDVVKIDVSLVHEVTHPHAPRVMNALTAHAERTGASIMAVGIETESHVRTARGLGAVLGQGFHFGRPGPLPAVPRVPTHPISLIPALGSPAPGDTPFSLATAVAPALPAAAGVLAALASHVEQRASLDPDPAVVLACLPKNQMMSGAPLAVLQMLARNASFIAALVGDAPPYAIPDVRMVRLADKDPLRREWTIIVLGPHYSAMLTARERESRRDPDEFSYRLVYDRATVVRAAQVILQRLHGNAA